MRLLIQGGTIITFGSPCRVLEGRALLLEEGRIERIAPAEEIPGPFDRVLDARGQLVLPGLVNAHMHFYSTLVRGLGKAAPSASFQEVLENLWWRLDRKLSLDDVEMSARIILIDAIRKVQREMVTRLVYGVPIRATRTRVELDESGFPSIGNAFLFSALLSELSGSLVELNAASEVIATLSASKLEFPWPVQIGI